MPPRHCQCAETIVASKEGGLRNLPEIRECADRLVRSAVLNDAAPFVPLSIKERGGTSDYSARVILLAKARYMVCFNHRGAEYDAAERVAILAAPERRLERDDKALVDHTGSRRALREGRRSVTRHGLHAAPQPG